MILKNTITAATQADGAQTIDLDVFDEARLHQIQFSTSATPTAGTLTIAIKTPGASSYVNLSPALDLTNGSGLFQFWGFAESIQFTPASFDALKTYTVTVISGIRG